MITTPEQLSAATSYSIGSFVAMLGSVNANTVLIWLGVLGVVIRLLTDLPKMLTAWRVYREGKNDKTSE